MLILRARTHFLLAVWLPYTVYKPCTDLKLFQLLEEVINAMHQDQLSSLYFGLHVLIWGVKREDSFLQWLAQSNSDSGGKGGVGGVRTETDCEGVSMLNPATKWLLYPRTKVATHLNATLRPQKALKKWGGHTGGQGSTTCQSFFTEPAGFDLSVWSARPDDQTDHDYIWNHQHRRHLAWMGTAFFFLHQATRMMLLPHFCHCI